MDAPYYRLADTPEAFAGMRYGDGYGGFELVYSAYEEEAANTTFLPCDELGKKWAVSKTAMARAAVIHDVQRRQHFANEREPVISSAYLSNTNSISLTLTSVSLLFPPPPSPLGCKQL